MKDEIKEILDYLNKFINDKEEITKYDCEISVKNAKLLLDYITNLQQIEQEHQRINGELRKENKRLNNIIDELEKILEYERNYYNGDIDIETHNIDSEFLRGNSCEADYILDKLKELKENK